VLRKEGKKKWWSLPKKKEKDLELKKK
jgi:hypothetical protein